MFIVALLITGTLTWFFTRAGNTALTSPLSQLPDRPSKHQTNGIVNFPANIPDVDDIETANSTLNFQKIFAINLPSRLDRKDLLTVMATIANLSITVVPGVRTLAENSLPPPRTPGNLRMEEYAVWRAHANVWRRVIEEGLTTALVLEDDNDWDISLKEQIPRILTALEEIRTPPLETEDDAVVRGGVGLEKWDMLYLGSCWEVATTEDKKNRTTFVPIPSDNENVAPHNYNWVLSLLAKW